MTAFQRCKPVIAEFLRYAVVGGISFIVDAGALVTSKELIFKGDTKAELAVCTAIGFICGLAANYLLSAVFVFTTQKQKKETKTLKAAVIYAAVGVIGFFLTEAGMLLGVQIVGSEGFWYVLVRCLTAGIVLVWNYVGRKIFVYKGN